MIKDGKIFGKINVIDFLVILLVIAVIAAGIKFVFFNNGGESDTLIMKFRIEEVDNFVAEKVKIGDSLYDDTGDNDLGTVIDVETDDSISYSVSEDGLYNMTSREGYKSMIITGEVKGRKTKLGAEIKGTKYGVGHSMVLRAGDAKLYLRVYDIQVKDAEKEDGGEKDGKDTVKAVITFYCPEEYDFVAKSVKDGADAYDTLKRTNLGKIYGVKTDKVIEQTATDSGVAEYEKDGYLSVEFKCEVNAEKTERGLEISGKNYYIGAEKALNVGGTKVETVVKDIEIK
ncbi:MAG: DUF4330 domain-containing protein [Clostridia bacterium]|nr:DUF4330 domain-containing protein [Clostridia bacterium]